MASTVSSALLKVNEFQSASGGSAWLTIDKSQLVSGMKERLQSPNLIDTSLVNLCGPGAFFRCLLEDDPVMYVEAIISLYRRNYAFLGSRKFTASYSLRLARCPTDMNPTDWILLASLRDDENAILNYDSASGTLSGLTGPRGMATWFGEAKYSGVANDTNVFFSKSLDHLKTASRLRTQGNRVCLLVAAKMLKATEQTSRSLHPDHWVVLMSDVRVDAHDNVSFDVYTWGRIRSVPGAGTLSGSDACKNYYGYVAARPPA